MIPLRQEATRDAVPPPTFIHHCLGCGVPTPHLHMDDVVRRYGREDHVAGSERFICVACNRLTFAHSDGADTFRFVLDGAAQEKVRA